METAEETTTIETAQAARIIDAMQATRDALHAHSLGYPLSKERADELRREIDHALDA